MAEMGWPDGDYIGLASDLLVRSCIPVSARDVFSSKTPHLNNTSLHPGGMNQNQLAATMSLSL